MYVPIEIQNDKDGQVAYDRYVMLPDGKGSAFSFFFYPFLISYVFNYTMSCLSPASFRVHSLNVLFHLVFPCAEAATFTLA